MRLHKCILIVMIFALAIGLTSPTLSFACWFTGAANQTECCFVCCQDDQACQQYLSGDTRGSGCTFNWYCLFRPGYCAGKCEGPGFCPFTVLDDDQAKLDALREIRDTRLLKTPLGKSLVNLYYQHAEEVTTILIDDEDLLAIAANITDEILERALEADSDGEMIIDRELLESILEVMDLIDDEAGPELSRSIKMIQREMKRKELFRKLGITIN